MILDYPKIYQDNELIGHGGNQDWYLDSWARKAGCASVSATDIFIYYTKNEREFKKPEYLDFMGEMFKVMTPGKRGFPYVYLFARRLSKLLNNCRYHIIRRPKLYDATRIVQASIDDGHPLGLLILTHRRRAIRDDLWHWVTIVGYEETEKNGVVIIFLDCGELKRIPARILFEKSRFNVVKMVRFFYDK